MRRVLLVPAIALAIGVLYPARGIDKAAVVNSRHDFRVTSSATIKASTTVNAGEQLCVFCHTPHNSNPGTELWNQNMGSAPFASYTSSTLQSVVGPVSSQDASKLCLSCHDGTIALGDTVQNGQIPFQQGFAYSLPASSPTNLAGMNGAGFTDDHPFAFTPSLVNPEMKAPPIGDPVKLVTGKVQCTSCHDPHDENQDQTMGMFLVKSNRASAMCVTCHTKNGWLGSAHQAPPDPVEDAKYTSLQGAHTGYTGVTNNACESCHKPHTPQVGQRLLKLPEEDTCFQCHDGSVATRNLKAEFSKQYRHPVLTTPSVHDAAENPNSPQFPLPETAPGTPRHSECADCHSGHESQATPAGYSPQAPKATPPLLGVRGQSSANTFLPRSVNEYEICFKCHADSGNKPQYTDTGTAGVGFGRNPKRQFDANNPTAYHTRIEFTTGTSSHPVVRPGAVPSAEVPSLRTNMVTANGNVIPSRPLTASSQIYCSDCHNNDTGIQTVDGGSGPAGPHASSYPHLLERSAAMEPVPGTPGGASSGLGGYTPNNFKLCEKCHDLNIVMSSTSTFPLHAEHMQMAGASCSTCHSSHSSSNPMLVNFDTTIVGGAPAYTRTAPGHGSCTLTCHGEAHAASAY